MRRIARFVALGYFAIVIVVAGLQFGGISRFAAPFNAIPAPIRPPIALEIIYSSEQDSWIKAAAAQFGQTAPTLRGRPVQIALRASGSQDIVDGIAQGRYTPTAIIPAGSAQLDALNSNGRAQTAADGADKPVPVALSPLVLVVWGDRADALFPAGGDVWHQLHDQQVKFGHASPLSANSGIEALALMAYAYHNKAQGLTLTDVGDLGFQRWLGETESNFIDRPIPASTDALFKAFLLKGKSAYDVAIVYESQALGEVRRLQSGELRVLYPPATTISDHPFAILSAAWIAPEQQEAARMFRDFLLGEPAQRLARQYGFRPANAAVSLNESAQNNPFPAALAAGVRPELPGTVAPPPLEVLDALRAVWRQQTGQ
jgi:ABC-type sulfate transport system substrate-binding protein